MPEEKIEKEESVLDWYNQLTPIFAERPNGDIVATMSSGDGQMLFTFSEIEQVKSKEIEVLLAVEWNGPDTYPGAFEARLNILSLSSQTAFARSLSKTFGKDVPWDMALTRVSSGLRKHLASRDESKWIGEITPRTSVAYLYEPFLLEGAPNIIFGKGGSAKTYIGLRLAISLATGLPFLGISPTKRAKTLFVDYEDTAEEAARRIACLLGGDDLKGAAWEDIDKGIRYFSAKGVPLADSIQAIKKIVEEHKITFILIDSAALAGGSEAEKQETATRFFAALSKLGGVTTLTIAHETKQENNQYAFGSIFWTNCARNIWNAAVTRDDITPYGGKSVHLGLYHRKCNSDRLRAPIPCLVQFADGLVNMKLDDFKYIDKEQDPTQRIHRRLIEGGAMSIQDITDSLGNLKKGYVSNIMTQGKGLGLWENKNGVWDIIKDA